MILLVVAKKIGANSIVENWPWLSLQVEFVHLFLILLFYSVWVCVVFIN